MATIGNALSFPERRQPRPRSRVGGDLGAPFRNAVPVQKRPSTPLSNYAKHVLGVSPKHVLGVSPWDSQAAKNVIRSPFLH